MMKRLITILSLVIFAHLSYGQYTGTKNIPGHFIIGGAGSDAGTAEHLSIELICPGVTVYPYIEDFEGATWPPACWSDPETEDFGWNKSLFGMTAHSGTEYAYCNLQNSELITPDFVLSSDSKLEFWYRAEDPAYPQDMAVKIGSTVIYQITGAVNTDYQRVQVLLFSYTGQTVAITFVGQTGTGDYDYGIALDDVMIRLNNNAWTGAFNNNWNDGRNWGTGFIPDQYDLVFIPASPSGGRFPIIVNSQTVECGDLIIQNGGTVTIETSGILNVKNPAP